MSSVERSPLVRKKSPLVSFQFGNLISNPIVVTLQSPKPEENLKFVTLSVWYFGSMVIFDHYFQLINYYYFLRLNSDV